MPLRNRWAVNRHLVIDDIDGKARYDNEIAKSWDGLLTRTRGRAGDFAQHPQDFVRVPPPEAPLRDVRSPEPASALAVLDVDVVRGVLLPRGAAQHLFSNTEYGIGTMIVGSGSAQSDPAAFVVR